METQMETAIVYWGYRGYIGIIRDILGLYWE